MPASSTSPTGSSPTARQAGFTLIELVLVLLIVGFLGAVAAPRMVDLVTTAEAVSVHYQAKQLNNNNWINRARCASGRDNCVHITPTGKEACEDALDEFLPGVDRNRYGVANISSAVPHDEWSDPNEWNNHEGSSPAEDAIKDGDGSVVPWAIYRVDRYLGDEEPEEDWLKKWDTRQPCVIYLKE